MVFMDPEIEKSYRNQSCKNNNLKAKNLSSDSPTPADGQRSRYGSRDGLASSSQQGSLASSSHIMTSSLKGSSSLMLTSSLPGSSHLTSALPLAGTSVGFPSVNSESSCAVAVEEAMVVPPPVVVDNNRRRLSNEVEGEREADNEEEEEHNNSGDSEEEKEEIDDEAKAGGQNVFTENFICYHEISLYQSCGSGKFCVDPDPAFFLNADPDADPDMDP